MTLTDRVRIEIDGDVDGDGTVETGVFEFGPAEEGAFRVEDRIETNYLINGSGQQVSGIFATLLGEGDDKNKGLFTDLGAGLRTWQIGFQNPGEQLDSDGNHYQWGASDDPSVVDETSATGAGFVTQSQILMNYLTTVNIGSRNPMRLHWGEYSDTGLFGGPINVVPQAPNTVLDNNNPHRWDGEITLVAAHDLNEVFDGLNQVLG